MADDAKASEAPAAPAPFVLHVVWHPQCSAAPAIAEELRRHSASDRYHDIAGGAGVTVLLRDADTPHSDAPPAIGWAGGEIVAVVVLLDHATVADGRWALYLHDITGQADERGLATRVFPVTLEAGALGDGLEVQALRWDRWSEDSEAGRRIGRLIRELTHEFTRMLRHWLRSQPDHAGDELRRYRQSIQVFLSHSKHDDHGEAVAKAIRGWFHEHSALASFLDVDDMTVGVRFDAAIDDAIRHGVLVAIYTDSYSSREWCRREAILAKRHGVPMLVVDCLQDKDDRAFPYLWNVPVVRMGVDQPERAGQVARRSWTRCSRTTSGSSGRPTIVRPHRAPSSRPARPNLPRLPPSVVRHRTRNRLLSTPTRRWGWKSAACSPTRCPTCGFAP